MAAHRDGAAALLRRRTVATVLTPHDGEYQLLTGERPQPDRIAAARALAAQTDCVVLLKGPATVVAHPDGNVLVSTTGDQRLATAGSGDVLSGIIGALLTGIFATNQINNALKLPNGSPAPLGWVDGNAAQLMNQGIGAVIGIAFGVIGTIIALKVTGLITPIRLEQTEETAGMDISLHGEEGYLFED